MYTITICTDLGTYKNVSGNDADIFYMYNVEA